LNTAGFTPRRHPARAGQSSFTDGGPRGPRPAGSLERCYNRALPAIRLPPLSFPRDRPPHLGRAPKRCRQVWPGPLRGRIPSAGPRPQRDGSLLGLAPECLGRVVPSGQPSTDSNRARTPERAGRRAPPQAHRGGGGLLQRWTAACATAGGTLVYHTLQSAAGRRSCDHGTGSGAVGPWNHRASPGRTPRGVLQPWLAAWSARRTPRGGPATGAQGASR
jgi:hypothetical protein